MYLCALRAVRRTYYYSKSGEVHHTYQNANSLQVVSLSSAISNKNMILWQDTTPQVILVD